MGGEGSGWGGGGDRGLQLSGPTRAGEVGAGVGGGLHGGAQGCSGYAVVDVGVGEVIVDSTDIPPGVVNILTSASNDVGVELTTNPQVDVISFTGSTPVGRAIMAAAAPTLKRVFLELGGKSAMVLLDDGDAATAAMMCAYAATSHSGQGCAITSRLVVPRGQYDDVVDLTRQMLAGIAYGDPADPAMATTGWLINRRQQEKVAGYVDRAVAEGAKAVIGGRIPEHLPKGFYYEPTLIAGSGGGFGDRAGGTVRAGARRAAP